jgi:hypothetical protein
MVAGGGGERGRWNLVVHFPLSSVSVLFPPAVGFFSLAYSGPLVELEFLVAVEVAVVDFFPGVLPGGLRRCVFRLPVQAQWV